MVFLRFLSFCLLLCCDVFADGTVKIGGPFSSFLLKDQDGELFANSEAKYCLVYFGYASCPSICPTALSNITTALSIMRSSQIERIDIVFISIGDDNQDALKMLHQRFHPKIRYLSCTPEQKQKVLELYKGFANKTSDNQINHTSLIYFMDLGCRNMISCFPHNVNPDELYNAIVEKIK